MKLQRYLGDRRYLTWLGRRISVSRRSVRSLRIQRGPVRALRRAVGVLRRAVRVLRRAVVVQRWRGPEGLRVRVADGRGDARAAVSDSRALPRIRRVGRAVLRFRFVDRSRRVLPPDRLRSRVRPHDPFSRIVAGVRVRQRLEVAVPLPGGLRALARSIAIVRNIVRGPSGRTRVLRNRGSARAAFSGRHSTRGIRGRVEFRRSEHAVENAEIGDDRRLGRQRRTENEILPQGDGYFGLSGLYLQGRRVRRTPVMTRGYAFVRPGQSEPQQEDPQSPINTVFSITRHRFDNSVVGQGRWPERRKRVVDNFIEISRSMPFTANTLKQKAVSNDKVFFAIDKYVSSFILHYVIKFRIDKY